MVILKEMNYIVLRSRGRTALSVCIAALLVCCMSFYLGSIQTAENAEKNLAQVIPVTASSTSVCGRPLDRAGSAPDWVGSACRGRVGSTLCG